MLTPHVSHTLPPLAAPSPQLLFWLLVVGWTMRALEVRWEMEEGFPGGSGGSSGSGGGDGGPGGGLLPGSGW